MIFNDKKKKLFKRLFIFFDKFGRKICYTYNQKNWSKEMDYIIEKNNNIIREKACIDTRL